MEKNKKLALNKSTITNLSTIDMNNVYGAMEQHSRYQLEQLSNETLCDTTLEQRREIMDLCNGSNGDPDRSCKPMM